MVPEVMQCFYCYLVQFYSNQIAVLKLLAHANFPSKRTLKKVIFVALSIVVASGPFSTGDVVFEPLEDLMKYLEKETPDVCLLVSRRPIRFRQMFPFRR